MVFNLSTLLDKTVLVTGGTAGIGKETAILFAKAGCNVIVTARREPLLQEVAALCEKANTEGGTGKGGKIISSTLDMRDRKAIAGFLDTMKQQGAPEIDILVNNAGLVHGVEKVGDINPDDIDVMMETNVIGLIHLTQAVVAQMKARNSGHIINMGSIAGLEFYPGGSIYCATKAAVRAFGTSLRKELVSTNIRVSEIQPGMVETDFSVTRFRGDKAAADKVYQGMEPLTGYDIAEEIVWVASRPPRVAIAEMLVFPTAQGAAQLVHRN